MGEGRKWLAWLSRNGWTSDCAAPAALQASRSYDPTGSKEYTAPVPERWCEDEIEIRETRTRTILLDSSENIVYIIREEPFGVEHGLDQTGDGLQRHVLCVCVLVPLESQDINARCGG